MKHSPPPSTSRPLTHLFTLSMLSLIVMGTQQQCPTEPPPSDDTVCYLGETGMYNACYQIVSPDVMPPDYGYPEPYQGSPQYREPIAYLDLYTISDSDMLAPNFAIDELAQDWKGQYAVLAPTSVDHLQDIRDRLGPIIVNSGYRSPAYNASVGGATWSRHMYGDAFDMYASNASLQSLTDTCYLEGAGYVQVYDTFVHCDWRDDPLEEVFFGPEPNLRYVDIDPLAELDAELTTHDGVWTAPAMGWDEGEPLREWRAFNGEGGIIQMHEGPAFKPLPGAATIEVTVGMKLVLTATLGATDTSTLTSP